MKSNNKQLAICAMFLISGLFFSGCGWLPFGKKSDQSSQQSSTGSNEVLMTIDGKPALTASEYEEQLEMARKANPQIEMFLQMMPNAEKEFVFRGMATARLMKAWAQKEGIDQTPEFKKQRQHLHEAMDLQLYMKHFDDAHPVNVTEADIAEYYEAKKDTIPGLAISAGGVDTSYVRFDSKAKAEKFFDKVKEVKKLDSFKSMAEADKQQVGQSTINEKSPFGDAIKKAVIDIKKFPSVQMIKASEGAYWVLFAAGKSEAKYHDLKSPQVQQGLRKMIADERKEKQLEAMVDQLKKEMNVVENNKYFEDKEAAKKAALQNNQSSSDDETNDEESEMSGNLKL
jgi:hypothetical protein